MNWVRWALHINATHKQQQNYNYNTNIKKKQNRTVLKINKQHITYRLKIRKIING